MILIIQNINSGNNLIIRLNCFQMLLKTKNPVRIEIIEKEEEYLYSCVRNYAELESFIKIGIIQLTGL
jgi:hypothetical protein